MCGWTVDDVVVPDAAAVLSVCLFLLHSAENREHSAVPNTLAALRNHCNFTGSSRVTMDGERLVLSKARRHEAAEEVACGLLGWPRESKFYE